MFRLIPSSDLRPTLTSLTVTLNAVLSVSSATFYWIAVHVEYWKPDEAQTALFKDPVRTSL